MSEENRAGVVTLDRRDQRVTEGRLVSLVPTDRRVLPDFQDFLVLMDNLDLQERLEQMDFQDWLARLDFLVTEVFLAQLARVVLWEWLAR